MPTYADPLPGKSRLAVLLEQFATIDDPRDVRRIAHPLAEILLLVVRGTIADCESALPRPARSSRLPLARSSNNCRSSTPAASKASRCRSSTCRSLSVETRM